MPRLLAIALVLALGGCGFAPLYGGDAGANVVQKLEAVQVANIPERPGQMLREALQQQFYTDGAPTTQLYSLSVNYVITTTGIGVQQDTSVTRNRIVANATWTLTPVGGPITPPLATGQASTADAENVIDQQYFALTLETDTVNQQLADQIAQAIDTEVAAYFRSHPQA